MIRGCISSKVLKPNTFNIYIYEYSYNIFKYQEKLAVLEAYVSTRMIRFLTIPMLMLRVVSTALCTSLNYSLSYVTILLYLIPLLLLLFNFLVLCLFWKSYDIFLHTFGKLEMFYRYWKKWCVKMNKI